MKGVGFGVIAGIVSFAAVTCLVIGSHMTKSAIASYCEMCGLLVPFVFDALYFKRKVLYTDGIACTLLIVL